MVEPELKIETLTPELAQTLPQPGLLPQRLAYENLRMWRVFFGDRWLGVWKYNSVDYFISTVVNDCTEGEPIGVSLIQAFLEAERRLRNKHYRSNRKFPT